MTCTLAVHAEIGCRVDRYTSWQRYGPVEDEEASAGTYTVRELRGTFGWFAGYWPRWSGRGCFFCHGDRDRVGYVGEIRHNDEIVGLAGGAVMP